MTDRLPGLKFLMFSLICLAFSVWLVAVIGNVSIGGRVSYSAEFTDVSNMLPNDQVKVAGVSVGKVTAINVLPGGTARVDFEVDSTVPVTTDSTLEIRWRDVIQLRFLYVVPGTGPAAGPDTAFPLAQTSGPADLNLLLQRLTPVMRALDPQIANLVTEALQTALVDRVDEVRALLRDGAQLTQTLASRDQQLRSLLSNSALVVDAYADREQELRGLLDSFADVSTTVAARNDTLETAVLSLADAQSQLRRLVEANDGNVRGALDELEAITAILSVNRDGLENIVTTLGRGLVAYHRVSSLGQWFNVNGVGVSFGEDTINSQRGGQLPAETSPQRTSSLAPFFLRTTAEAR
ncbi:MAG: phospholipid/cholesterol/gamma-HCH transport system substrate-binding protein [Glaciecola sp.]|jgi:phospholipid/cholesterol/gamma-HCH transport system substrate-binding protein